MDGYALSGGLIAALQGIAVMLDVNSELYRIAI
jgi:hypothetical protein